jgi:lipopolysaccharide/colanic/teichoic acid biosynthesis glycosyltransferase
VAKANVRLQSPSSHTRIWSRVAILDVIWGAASPAAAYLLRDAGFVRPNAAALYCGVSLLISLLVFQWFRTSSPISRFYSLRDGIELLKACVLIAALSAVATFLLTRLEEAPRSIPILHLMLLASGLLGIRLLLRLRDTRRETRRVEATHKVEHILIIGASRLAWFFSNMVEELTPGGYQIVAILDERSKLKHRSLNGYPIIGSPMDLEKVIADYAMHGVYIDNVVVAAQPDEIYLAARAEVRRVCESLKIGFEFLPERLMAKEVPSNGASLTDMQPAAVFSTPSNLRLSRPYWKVKRVIDIVVALALAILVSPLIIVVSTLVLLDVGAPIVFWQRRIGRNGAPLHLYKFRTLQTLFDRNTKARREAQQPSLLGRFFQRTRLDELPQLWNVLSGDMSLIGPRPLLPVDQPDDFTTRLAVRPGVTGWAQVCGGKSITAEEKAALDEWYIRHASLWRDICIVGRTLGMLLVTGDRRDEKAITAALQERAVGQIAGTHGANGPVPKSSAGVAIQPALTEISESLTI